MVPLEIGRSEDFVASVAASPLAVPTAPVRLHVLCAEDDRVNQMVAVALINRMGHALTLSKMGSSRSSVCDKDAMMWC